jgi:AraC-like DNA-binding protein
MAAMGGSADINVFVQVPRPVLRPFVKRFLVVEVPTPHQDSHLPDTGFVAAFPYKGEALLDGGTKAPQAALTGLWSRTRRHEHSSGSAVLLVAFTAIGAAAILRHPANELFNKTAALDALLDRPAGLSLICEQIAEARSHAGRIQAVENFLSARLADARPDAFVTSTVAMIEEARGMVRIQDVARRVGLSQSALERRFRRVVGVPPKRFASLVRLKHVEHLRAGGASLTSIAHRAGYFDQSHFIHEFKRVTGTAPELYFATHRQNAEFLQFGDARLF